MRLSVALCWTSNVQVPHNTVYLALPPATEENQSFGCWVQRSLAIGLNFSKQTKTNVLMW